MIELVELMDEMIKRISLTKLSVSNAPGSKGITSVFLPGIQIKNSFFGKSKFVSFLNL